MLKYQIIGIIGLCWPVIAEAEPLGPQEVTGEAIGVESGELARLRKELAEAEAAGASKAEEAETLNALLDSASRMLDPRMKPADRVAAVGDLVSGRDPRVLRLAWVGSQVRSAAVREAVVDLVADWDHPEVVALLEARARSRWDTRAIRLKAVLAIRDRGDAQAATILYALATDKSIDSDVRAASLAALDQRFPEFMVDKVRPAIGGSVTGVGALVAANALTGGVMLNSVGIWGKADSAPEVGALSGAVIGGATAGLYARSNPISTGAGLGYASNVAWGLAGGAYADHIVYWNDDSASAENMGALFRTLGVGAGAVTGYHRIGRNPDVEQVWRVNAAGLLGSQLGRASTGLGQGLASGDPGCDLAPNPDACWARDDAQNARRARGRSVGIVAGAGLGLAAGTLLDGAWDPSAEDVVLAGVLGAETAIAASMMSTIVGRDDLNDQFADMGLFTGVTGGLVASHFQPVSLQQSAMMAYGAAVGNVFGLGVTMLPSEAVSAKTRSAVVLSTGVVGTGLGAWSHTKVQPTPGDWTMVGVGTVLSGINVGAVTYIVDQSGGFKNDNQPAGAVITGTTLASAGFMAAAARWDPEPGDSLFMGTSAAWGGFYGSLGQVAFDTQLSPVARVATGTALMDVGLGVGALIVSDATAMSPKDTLWPQLFGVAGATMGSLGVMLGTSQAQPVAIGALSGATLGLGVGALLGPKIQSYTAGLEIPGAVDLPGHWHVLALPAVQENGEMGAAVGLTVTGL